MNKYFKFIATLSLPACVAQAQQMPLLQVDIDRKDIQNLIAVQRHKTIAQKVVQLTRFYPELEFGRLADEADEDVKFIRKYDSPASNRPKILLKWPASEATLPRALIHYFIDRARLRKYHEVTEAERRSFRRLLMAEFAEIKHGLSGAAGRSDDALKALWQARLTLNVLERQLAGAGEDIESVHFLLQHREEIGLAGEDLTQQYKELQKNLDVISSQAILLVDEAAAMEEVLKWPPLADRLLGVFDRLEEIEAHVGLPDPSPNCEERMLNRRVTLTAENAVPRAMDSGGPLPFSFESR